jgi:hypothetical protein
VTHMSQPLVMFNGDPHGSGHDLAKIKKLSAGLKDTHWAISRLLFKNQVDPRRVILLPLSINPH